MAAGITSPYQARSRSSSVAAVMTCATPAGLAVNSRRATIRPGAPGRSSRSCGGSVSSSPLARRASKTSEIPSTSACVHDALSVSLRRRNVPTSRVMRLDASVTLVSCARIPS